MVNSLGQLASRDPSVKKNDRSFLLMSLIITTVRAIVKV